jgi:hypothetical protein
LEATVSLGDGLVVVTSCTAQKVVPANGAAQRDSTAESLYAGQQHVRLMRGVRAYRAAHRPLGPLRLHILSAYHGLVPAARRVATYDHTFAGQPRDVVREHARQLGVPDRIRALLKPRYGLGVLLLGDDYLEACALDSDVRLGGPTIALCAPNVAKRLPALEGLRIMLLHNREAQRFSCGLVALKGELGGRLLSGLAATPASLDAVTRVEADLLAWLDEQPATTSDRVAA